MLAKTSQARLKNEAGFSLVELLIAMTVTVIVMGAGVTLLSQGLGMRTRENKRSDALADAQRSLNLMTREIANSGFGLTDNGIVAGASDSNAASIRFRTNIINTNSTTTDADEDVTYVYQGSPNFAIVRYDQYPSPNGTTTDVATRIDLMQLTYYDSNGNVLNVAGTPSLVASAVRIGIAVSVTVPGMGAQPSSQVQLTSDVMLRNAQAILDKY